MHGTLKGILVVSFVIFLKHLIVYEILLQKLKYYGIQDKILDWFTSCLASRKQRVELKPNSAQNYLSKWEIVKHGVPQGSVLGPLLFNTYINDFPLGVNTTSNAIMFADDTSVLISNKNFNEFKNAFNTVLNHITKWFHANQPILNMDKMNIIKFTPTNIVCNPLTIEYDGKVLTEVTNFKFLGLHIDNRLNWRRHIEQILPKLSAACYTIRKLMY
jgi:hypothetical protein